MTRTPDPSGYASPPTAAKYRPRARWWVVGGALLVLAPLAFVASLFTVLAPLFQEDAVLPADGQPRQVSVAAGEERALFTPQGSSASCSVTDGSGTDLKLRRVSGEFTVNEWLAVARFDTGDGDLSVACDGGGTTDEVRIGSLPAGSTIIVGLLAGILVPIALGGAGLVVLVVTGVLHASRPPRPSAV